MATASVTAGTAGTNGTNVQRAYQFQADLDRAIVQLRDRARELYVNVVMLFFLNIVVGGDFSPGTPVDTGFARNSWTVGVDGIAPFRQGESHPAHAAHGPHGSHEGAVAIVSVEEGMATIVGLQIGDTVHLSSNAAYMNALEDGHSQQAPTGFIWLAIHAAQQIVDQVAREMLS